MVYFLRCRVRGCVGWFQGCGYRIDGLEWDTEKFDCNIWSRYKNFSVTHFRNLGELVFGYMVNFFQEFGYMVFCYMVFLLRELPFMTSALEGGRGFMEKQTKVTEVAWMWQWQGLEGVKKIRDFCGRHIWKAPYTVSFSWDKREPYIQNPVFYGILPSLADRADTHVCLTHPEYIEESDSWLREAGFVNKATGWSEEPE